MAVREPTPDYRLWEPTPVDSAYKLSRTEKIAYKNQTLSFQKQTALKKFNVEINFTKNIGITSKSIGGGS